MFAVLDDDSTTTELSGCFLLFLKIASTGVAIKSVLYFVVDIKVIGMESI